ncbi:MULTISPECIES: uridine kinase [unclassified Clostridium]|uniref:uridine kinase n=1 Tax=unclassified Clostridium TaxID=2614128 RepID=UPI0002977B77|nr:MULTISPECIES: uridine kinase [unclassified Clostridium]EKQ50529.1 MAG: uridine kinase [Clostridium sp. Maddingley MBC34-26]
MTIKSNRLKIELHNFHIFIISVTILKIILMGLFSSDYQNKMFMPFVDNFISSILDGNYVNTYEYYYVNRLVPSFPYPPFMLLIESIGGFGVHMISSAPLVLKNIIFKLPNLFFDFLGLYYLMKLYPHRRKYIGILYFASPIIIYSIYMHGQLDIIPTTLLTMAIYYLVQKGNTNDKLFVLFLGCALLTKFHIIAVLPVIFIYIYKKDGLKKALKLLMFTIVFVSIVIIPFLSNGFIQSVLFNNDQTVLTKVFITFVNIKLYIPIIAVMFIYLKEFNMTNINRELMITFCGVLFAVFLAFVPPMPAWYVWIVPFITIFFISVHENKYKSLIIYMLLNGFYLVYFIFFHETENVDLYFQNNNLTFLKLNNEILGNIMFTLLTGTLIFTIYIMYKLGVSSNSFYKRRNIPFTIGIAGDSGSGKSTLIELVKNCLGNQNLLFIEGDGDHKWERGEEMWKHYTHLNPKANYLYRQALDVQTLRKGDYVKRVDYDHDTGKFSSANKIRPKKFILLCGLHSLYLPQMRKILDLKIYMDADESLRRYWKIQRDTKHRGYTKEKILEQIESRMPDAYKYIYPQKEYADLIIEYFDKGLVDCCIDNYNIVMSIKLTLSAAVNLEPIIGELSQYGVDIKYDYSEDLKKQTVIFDGASLEGKIIEFNEIADRIITQIDEITTQNLNCKNNISGIIQLVLLVIISHKMQGEL